MATKSEMKHHVKKGTQSVTLPTNVSIEESWGMSQWMDDEELLTDYPELRRTSTSGSTILLMFVVIVGLAMLSQGKFSPLALLDMPAQTKAGEFFSMHKQ